MISRTHKSSPSEGLAGKDPELNSLELDFLRRSPQALQLLIDEFYRMEQEAVRSKASHTVLRLLQGRRKTLETWREALMPSPIATQPLAAGPASQSTATRAAVSALAKAHSGALVKTVLSR